MSVGKAERRPRGDLARVLVVDDEADIRELLDLTMARMGPVSYTHLDVYKRQVLFYAAMATLAVLFEQSYRALQNDFDAAGFFQAGIFCAGFFAVAVSARLLARRVIANEALARQRGVDLNLSLIHI